MVDKRMQEGTAPDPAGQDITERKRSEKVQRESEERFRSIYDNIGTGISVIGKNMDILSLNPQMQRWFPHIDTSRHPVCYRSFNIPPRDSVCEYRPTILTMQDGNVHNAVTSTPTPTGVRHYHIVSTPLFASDGTIASAIEMVEDITEQKQAEEALRAAEQKYRSLIETTDTGYVIIDRNGRVIDANRKYAELCGCRDRENVLGRSVLEWTAPYDRERNASEVGRCMSQGYVRNLEIDYLTPAGKTTPIEINATVLGSGDSCSILSLCRDISERKKTGGDLELFKNLLNKSNEAVFVNDPQTGRIIDMNDRACAGLGYERAELLNMEVRDFETSFPGDLAWQDHVTEVRKHGFLLLEGRMKRKDGSTFPVETSVSLVVLGAREYMMAVVRDIAERIRSEAALRAREKQLAESQRIAHIGSWEHNLTTNRAIWSDELFRLLGLDPKKDKEDFPLFLSMVHPDDQPHLKRAIEEVAQFNKPFSSEYRFILKDGTVRIIHAMGELIRDDIGTQNILSGTAQDITARKQAETALKEANAKLQALIRALPDSVFFKDTNRRYLMVNRVFEEITGAGQEAFIGKTDEDFMPPHLAEGCRESDEALMKSGRSVNVENTIIGRNGGKIFFDSVKAPIYDSHGVLLGIVGVSRDVTERKLAEDELKQSEQFIRNILDTVDEGFIVVDRNFSILTANKAYCSQVDLHCDGVIGKHCYEISHGKNRPCYEEGEECAVRQVFETGEPHSALHKHSHDEGHVLYVETKGFPIKDAAGNVTSVIETVNNITEKHLLEEERLKTQKLESIGTLAGGIAHDFNNLLQGIFGYISMAKMNFGQKEKSLAMLEQAENALQQSVNLTTQLLTFSKGGKPVKKLIDLRPVIEDSTKFTLSGSRSDFCMDIPEDLWQAEADEGQIGQMIQNIVLNADQAMPLGGSVMARARNVAAGDSSLPSLLASGNYVAIAIQDTGVGIPEQYIGKIFDPYFTTKEKGSGLGLATSYSIVRNHGGMIDVKTKPGEGSTFMIYLPAIAGEGRKASAPRPAEPSLGRAAQVLVMDDEELLRNLSSELIGTLGHKVEVAKHGREALAKYQGAMAAGKPFDIVILDLTVRGGMGGAETLQKLLEVDPAVKAIVSSGYSDDATIANHLSLGFKAYLKKPYNIGQLRAILISLLS